MVGWSITRDPVQDVLRLYLPEYLSVAVARAAITDLVNKLNERDRPSTLMADFRAVHRIDPDAPIVGARICSQAVSKIEHVYILTDNPVVRTAAASAAGSIGLRFTCHAEEPALTGSQRRVGRDETETEF